MPGSRKNRFPLKQIVVSVDRSKHSAKAFDAALDIAHRYKSSLIIVHVLTYPIQTNEVDLGDKLVGELVDEARDAGIEVGGRVVRSRSSVLQGILKEAELENADLIVVGTRGLAGLRKFLQGSVSSGVATHSQQSVLIVK